jgi:signal transduction histidine kinase/CheY-like chemotaxis protein
MLDSKIIELLQNSINQNQDLLAIANIFKEETNSNVCNIFLKGKSKYIHLVSTDSNIEYTINTETIIQDLTFDTELINMNNKFRYHITIPIQTLENYLGCLHLANNEFPYTEELLNTSTIGLSIIQIILEKEKILYEKNILDIGKDLFLANMSHEIRTPANGVIGYSQLLMQTQLSSTQKAYLQSQSQCSLQLMQIINDILDFSKLTAGKMEVRNECFSIQEIIETIKNTMSQKIEEKNQKIQFIISENVHQFIISDKQKLIQILINLISNAHKFTDVNGRIKVGFSIEDNYLVVSVVDNGIGIEKSKQEKLFSIYEQIENNGTKTGSGLGLAICEKLCKLLLGNITVNSTLGKGSEFIVKIDYKPYEDFENKLTKDLDLLHEKTILIVDDNPDNRIVLTEILFEWKMKPIACASALEALRLIMGNRHDFALGLIDIVMPGTSGVELAKQIKEEKPFFPMIALSSLDTFVNTKEFEEKLDKPINKIKLLDTIYRTLIKEIKPKSYIGQSDFISLSKSIPFTEFKKDSKILIAEDILYNRTLLQNMLESLNYTNITTTENGKEAFDEIEKAYTINEPYQILLLDLRMPIMNGFEVIDKIKINNWKLPEIVVVTASTMDSDIISCKEKGVNYFITKPIDIQSLNEVMLHVSTNK